MAEFDSFADGYDAALNQGLAVSGEDKDFFAKGRIDCLSQCLNQLGFQPGSVLDFGCGTGSATPHLISVLRAASVIGLDLSDKSLQVARQRHAHLPAQFQIPSNYTPSASIDLAFCNGVFHHIPPEQRADTVKYIADCLRPSGVFALWENNPWNPGTRYVMSRIPFDRDAIMLSARTAAALMRSAGLTVIRTDYRFIFPRPLNFLRGCEPYLAALPLGAQYQVLGRLSGQLANHS